MWFVKIYIDLKGEQASLDFASSMAGQSWIKVNIKTCKAMNNTHEIERAGLTLDFKA